MDTTPKVTLFDSAYLNRTGPWIIGEPQPALLDLERRGWIRGRVLDAGCGSGEHTIFLTRLGYDVVGIDLSGPALEEASANAAGRGVPARFEAADALHLPADERFDTIIDSALFHIFGDEDRVGYVRSLHGACRPGGVAHVLALSDAGPGLGPQISDRLIREAFVPDHGWTLESLEPSRYRVMVSAEHAERLELEPHRPADMPAWLARARRR
ncbi:MAG TPA: class I SAM-dependent methyltransferase [Candidatus Binatia bacterium]|jgi:SAM-dependent methyltransferase|nr:class I SAM-dependent methyltransferase [Candidatus Binatia bacterium]